MLSVLLVQIINHTRLWSLLNKKKKVEHKQKISLRYVSFWDSWGESFITIITDLFLISDIKA